jgi:hypothetical protein
LRFSGRRGGVRCAATITGEMDRMFYEVVLVFIGVRLLHGHLEEEPRAGEAAERPVKIVSRGAVRCRHIPRDGWIS